MNPAKGQGIPGAGSSWSRPREPGGGLDSSSGASRPLETGLGPPLGHVLGPSHPGDLPLTQSPGPASGHFRGKSRQGCREPRRAVLSDETSTQPGATQSCKGSSRSAQLLPRAPRPGSGYPGAGPKPRRPLVSGPTAPCGPQSRAEVRPHSHCPRDSAWWSVHC